jgi:hypothetical protein
LSEFAFGFRGEGTIFPTLIFAAGNLRLADEAVVLDNSDLHPVRMLLFENGVVIWRAEVLAVWAGQLARFQESRN